MRMLHLQVNSGLVSRMRAVVGALAYCRAVDRKLAVDWPYRDASETLGYFGARFHDLWSNDDIEETDVNHRKFLSLRPDNAEILESPEEYLAVRTCHIEPFLKWIPDGCVQPFAEELIPGKHVREVVAKFLPQIQAQRTIGVNIRAKLPQPGTAKADWFYDRIKEIVGDAHLFVAVDCRPSLQRMWDAVGMARVLTQEKTFVYDREGIIKTCADLYLLAACDYMVGSNYSSYSQMAAFLRGAKYIGPHDKASRGLSGGRYEDLWNPPESDSALS